MKRTISIITALFLIIAIFAGCSAQSDTAEQSETDTTGTAAAVSSISGDEMFSDRDKEIGYSEAESTIITLADGASSVSGSGAEVKGDAVTITKEGTYILTGSLTDGQIVVNTADDAKIQVVLDGAEVTSKSSAAIYVKSADKVFITTAYGTENIVKAAGEFTQTDDNNVDGAIFAKSDLTLNGAGTLTIESAYGHGVVSKDDLAVTSGTYVITSAKQGLSGKDSVRIADGTFTIEAGTDAVHAENEDDTTLGFVYISGGTMNLSAEKQGIQATSTATIVGGKIDISKSYEGIEGLVINISGGKIGIVSSDDGLNAAAANTQIGGGMGGGMAAVDGCEINISGGSLNIDASGDGIDSNGDLTISGGTITVSGPTERNDGTLDYNGTGEITGGTLLGAGSSGMALGFSDSSTQCSILYNLTSAQEAGTKVVLSDSNGNILAEFSPVKQFQSVNISVPSLNSGSVYTLAVGSEEYTIELTSTSFSNGGMGGGNMGGGMGGGNMSDQPKGGDRPGGGTGGPQGGMPNDATSSATVTQS
ncbi:MAG: carbohydrate-binding domain-containing protein [Oscillospiraceae bacterium]|nr:carbohydrate-binding domain-containing protein [Oscillospiraceae bacterium]